MTAPHVITGADDNYAAGVLVLIASAAWHTPGLRITVLDNGISAANRARIDALGLALGLDLSRIELDGTEFADLPVRRGHLTRSTYLRLAIPRLMPDAARVIYMDCDMAVTGDLTPLADLPLGDALVAAVPDLAPDAAELADTGLAQGEYVNAGLLVMNLPLWRAEDTAGACARLLKSRALRAEDQSALNIVARGRVLLLPLRYNAFADPAAYDGAGPAFPGDAAVVHYVVGLKPWSGHVPLGALWQAHADRIADWMPPLNRTWTRRLSGWNRRRKLWLGLVTGRAKYRARLATLRRMARFEAACIAALNGPGRGRTARVPRVSER